MEAKHTPGPWRLSRTQRYVMDGVAAPWVCEVTERPGWEANARLIASAPALVEALKEAHKVVAACRRTAMCEVIGGNHRFEGVPEILKDDLARIDAAISQAEGGE